MIAQKETINHLVVTNQKAEQEVEENPKNSKNTNNVI
jgi:hypothetical protein